MNHSKTEAAMFLEESIFPNLEIAPPPSVTSQPTSQAWSADFVKMLQAESPQIKKRQILEIAEESQEKL